MPLTGFAQAGDAQTSEVATLPIVVPNTAGAGDVAIIHVDAHLVPTLTTPSGWTLLGSAQSSSNASAWVFGKELVSGDIGATVNLVFSAASRCVAEMQTFSGHTLTGHQIASTTQTSGTGTYPIPTLTSVPAGAMMVPSVLRRRNGVSGDITMPSPYTETVATDVGTEYPAGANCFATSGYAVTATGGTVGGENASSGLTSIGSVFLLTLPEVTAPSGITFVGAGAAVAGGTGTLTPPLPSGIADGDLLMLHVVQSGPNTTDIGIGNPGDEWSVVEVWQANATGRIEVGWATAIKTSTTPAPAVPINTGSLTDISAVAFVTAWRGVDTAKMVGNDSNVSVMGSASSSGVSGATITASGVPLDPTGAGGMALALVATANDVTPYPSVTGWTKTAETATITGYDASLGVFHRDYGSGSATDSFGINAGQGATTPGIVVQVALYPGVAATDEGAKVRNTSWASRTWDNNTDIVVPKIDGLKVGDLMIAHHACDDDGSLASLSPPTGWTALGAGGDAAGGGAMRLYYRVAQAGDIGSSFTFGKPANLYSVAGIIAFHDWAGTPTATYATGASSTSSPAPSVTGTNKGVLTTWHLAGGTTDISRNFDTPAGMYERLEAPNAGWWIETLVATGRLTADGATGTRTATLDNAGAYVTASVAVEPLVGGQGAVALSGSGSLSFGAGPVAVSGAVALSGSGALSFPTRLASASGALPALAGSGTLTLVGALIVGGGLALGGSGALAFPTRTPGARGTLALAGAGSLTVGGGGGAGHINTSGSGALALTPGATGQQGTLARTGAGALAFTQAAITARGTLARTGAGNLVLVQAHMTARGAIDLTGAGQLAFTPVGMTTALQAWDAATSTWKPVLVMAWEAVASAWRSAAGRRIRTFDPSLDPVGAVGPAAPDKIVLTRERTFGPTGEVGVTRATRTASEVTGNSFVGSGTLAVVDRPIPAGTWVEIDWWMRVDAEREMLWSVGAPIITAAESFTATTEWRRFVYVAQLTADWETHRFRTPMTSWTEGQWIELSDIQLRTWT